MSFLRSSAMFTALNRPKRDRAEVDSLVSVPYESTRSDKSRHQHHISLASGSASGSDGRGVSAYDHLPDSIRPRPSPPLPDREREIAAQGYHRPKRPRLAAATSSLASSTGAGGDMSIPLPTFSGLIGESWEPFERRLECWLRTHSIPDTDDVARLDSLVLCLPPYSPSSTWYAAQCSTTLLDSFSFVQHVAHLRARYGTELRRKMNLAAALNRLDIRTFRDQDHKKEMVSELVDDLESLLAQAGIEAENSKREYLLRCFRGFSAAQQMMLRSPTYDGAIWACLQWESSVISKVNKQSSPDHDDLAPHRPIHLPTTLRPPKHAAPPTTIDTTTGGPSPSRRRRSESAPFGETTPTSWRAPAMRPPPPRHDRPPVQQQHPAVLRFADQQADFHDSPDQMPVDPDRTLPQSFERPSSLAAEFVEDPAKHLEKGRAWSPEHFGFRGMADPLHPDSDWPQSPLPPHAHDGREGEEAAPRELVLGEDDVSLSSREDPQARRQRHLATAQAAHPDLDDYPPSPPNDDAFEPQMVHPGSRPGMPPGSRIVDRPAGPRRLPMPQPGQPSDARSPPVTMPTPREVLLQGIPNAGTSTGELLAGLPSDVRDGRYVPPAPPTSATTKQKRWLPRGKSGRIGVREGSSRRPASAVQQATTDQPGRRRLRKVSNGSAPPTSSTNRPSFDAPAGGGTRTRPVLAGLRRVTSGSRQGSDGSVGRGRTGRAGSNKEGSVSAMKERLMSGMRKRRGGSSVGSGGGRSVSESVGGAGGGRSAGGGSADGGGAGKVKERMGRVVKTMFQRPEARRRDTGPRTARQEGDVATEPQDMAVEDEDETRRRRTEEWRAGAVHF